MRNAAQNSNKASNADVNGLTAFAFFLGMIPPITLRFASAISSLLFFVAVNLIKSLGFGRGINGIGHNRSRSLNVRNSLGHNVLGQGVRRYNGWYGRYLHIVAPLLEQNDYCTCVINKHLIIESF